MRNVSSAFMRALSSGRRDYYVRADITLNGNFYGGTSVAIKVVAGEQYLIKGTRSSITLNGTEVTTDSFGYFTITEDGDLRIYGGSTDTFLTCILHPSNEDIWTDGLTVEDAVSNDDVFEVGAAIINQGKVVLNNIYDKYTKYDFEQARVVLYVGLTGLDDGSTQVLRMGTYFVDEQQFNGSIITLTCLDYMAKFDRAYTEHTGYPATLNELVRDACTRCGVTLASSSSHFPNDTYHAPFSPSGESTTYRQVISWCAQIAGCFARCNKDGELEIKFYDFDTLQDLEDGLDGGCFDDGTPRYTSGDTADGGSFNPWNTGYGYDNGSFTDARPIHNISSCYSYNMARDDVVITGVRVVEQVDSNHIDDYAAPYVSTRSYAVGDYAVYSANLYKCISAVTSGSDFDPDKWMQVSILDYLYGTEGYVISIEGNELIKAITYSGEGEFIVNREYVAKAVGDALIGVKFRKVSITHPSDPSIEAGDIGVFQDPKGNQYNIIISSTNFNCGGSQSTSSSAETPRMNTAQRFTESTRNYVAMRQQMFADQSYLEQKIAESSGLYSTEVADPTGGVKIYYHNNPVLAESDIQMLFTTAGFTLTADGGTTWYGMTVDGQFIANILNANGVNADWIRTGQFIAEDANHNETFYVDTETGTVRIKATSFSLTDGTLAVNWFGNGVPTNSNYPVSTWTLADRVNHVNEFYYDEGGTGTYRYIQGEKVEGIRVKVTGTVTAYSSSGWNTLIWFTGLKPGDTAIKSYVMRNPIYVSDGTINQTFFIPGVLTSNRTYPFVLQLSKEVGANLTLKMEKDESFFPTAEPGNRYSLTSSVVTGDNVSISKTAGSGDYGIEYRITPTFTIEADAYRWERISQDTVDTEARDQIAALGDDLDYFEDNLYGQEVLDRLSENGVIQGMWIENNRLYISFDSARGGYLRLGGATVSSQQRYGALQIYDTANNLIGSIDRNGLQISPSPTLYIAGDTIKIQDGWVKFTGDVSGSAGEIGPIDLSNSSQGWAADDETFGVHSTTSASAVVIVSQSLNHGIRVDNTDTRVFGTFLVSGGTKSRMVEDTSYGDRLLYSCETPTPYFGDIGTGRTDENGEAVISIDDIFDETINANVEYSVFLQKEGQGDLWVDEKDHSFFIVKGTPNLKFSWELKAVQKGFETLRLDDHSLLPEDEDNLQDLTSIFNEELNNYNNDIINNVDTLDSMLSAYDAETEELFA